MHSHSVREAGQNVVGDIYALLKDAAVAPLQLSKRPAGVQQTKGILMAILAMIAW
jgi:hypothetical protein